MIRRRFPFAALAVMAFACALPDRAAAQTYGADTLSGILVDLLTNDIVLQGNANPAFDHEAHFKPGVNVREAPYLFNQSMAAQLSTFPLGTSSGGFSYTFNPETGLPRRTTDSFGPAFADRALTLGRGRLDVGFNYQHVGYSSFEGRDLEDGSLKFYIRHKDAVAGAVPTLFFEGDLVEANLSLKLRTDTFALSGNYGVSDRLDVGVVVPIVRVNLEAAVDAQILRLSTGSDPALSSIHRFPNGTANQRYARSGSATGVGDILFRAKYRLFDMPGGGLAAAVDLRLPSGREEDLLGTGATQLRLGAIVSGTAGRLSPHANLGYTFSGGGSNAVAKSDEFNYATGIEVPLAPSLTVGADLLGRSLRNFGRLRMGTETFRYQVATSNGPGLGQTLGPVQDVVFPQFQLEGGSVNTAFIALGGKFNPWRNTLVSAQLLLPVSDAGLRASPTPVIGLSVAF